MTFPLKDPLPGQFDYILQDIRDGLTLPDHFADDQDDQGEENEYTRWWEIPADPANEQFHNQKGR